MPDQKVDNLLNLSMDATPKEREKSENLNVGYDPETRRWDVIVKRSGEWTCRSGDRGSAAARRLCGSDFTGSRD